MQKYQIKDSVLKKRSDHGAIHFDKYTTWDQNKQKDKELGPPVETFDAGKVAD